MKKLLLIVQFICLLTGHLYGQTVKLYFPNDTNNVNTAGQVINKGDNFDVVVYADGNSNTSVRALYFDFEYTNTAFELLGVDHTGTGGNGGIIPYGSQISMDYQNYPGYSWKSTQFNNVADGNIKYQTADYTYTPGGSKTILRVYLNWAVAQGGLGKDRLLILHFKLKTTAPGYTWDPIKMNFAAAYNQNGTSGSTIMTTPLTSVIMLDPAATRYVNPTIETNSNIDDFTLHRVVFINTTTNIGIIADATNTGVVNIDQSQLEPNTEYKVMMMINMDTMLDLYDAAVTVSDYTTAQAEFVSQNLDGTFKNQSITTGLGYFAADVNRNRVFDGGDLTKLYGHVIGVDDLVARPTTWVAGTDMYASVPTFTDSTFNAMTTESWKTLTTTSVRFKTGLIGENKPLKLKFVIPGDINRSHSSQVMIGNSVATNAIPSLKKNLAASKVANLLINTTQTIPSINVNLKNIVTTASTIDIPVEVDASSNVAALQFEFTYDPTKIKFEQIFNDLPNTWYTFVDNKEGKIKFGALDKEAKNSVTGKFTPFKLRFSSVVNPLDLNTYIKVTPNMDAASKTGYQLGINLSTDSIKLTGYNNF
jgi:hypothetical protein